MQLARFQFLGIPPKGEPNPNGVEQIHFLVHPDPISKLSARL